MQLVSYTRHHSTLARFILLFAFLYAAFGVNSPFFPSFLRGCLETFGEGGWPGRGVIPDGCRSQSGQPHVDPGHPSAA